MYFYIVSGENLSKYLYSGLIITVYKACFGSLTFSFSFSNSAVFAPQASSLY
jgi:hypothetical protein